MKLKFKHQAYQAEAVRAVVDCFAGQPRQEGVQYRIDPGRREQALNTTEDMLEQQAEAPGFRNHDIALPADVLLRNVQSVQRGFGIDASSTLTANKVAPVNLDVEMETGTGKTYVYIKTLFELNRRYGWSKFVVVVPSIAIREGVAKTLEITAEHFQADYQKRARFFIYNSKSLHELESFSSGNGINVMIINVQAFAARGKDARRIYEELDDFQSRRPIDVIRTNRPIVILDEPQKMEGPKTKEALQEFAPLFVLRYSATHRTQHDKVYRLDALDAYNQKLVKKIAVRGISVKGLSGTSAYLYLEGIEISAKRPPVARLELEVRQGQGIKRITRKIGRNDNLFALSGELDAYKDGFVVADIDARTDTLSFTNGVILQAGDALGDVNEATLRRIQIREAVRAHFEKEQALFDQGIKVLSLFFIDEVAKYRRYQDDAELPGEYATVFEEEYTARLNEILSLEDTPYQRYLKGIDTRRTHNGYFSVDKKTKHLVDPKTGKRSAETDDVDAYDLILKDKERLLSLDEPTRFIFSHSALREGWDNPNVFVICTLKHSDNTVSRRQEVGRGLRLAVNQHGERLDDPATVHQVNVLTVVASESYRDFVAALQKDLIESLSARPRVADADYFKGKVLHTDDGEVTVTERMARQIYKYLAKHDYVDDDDHIAAAYHEAKEAGTREPLPDELAAHADQIFALIDAVFSEKDMPPADDGRRGKDNPTNANFEKREFKELWQRIHRKAAYTVEFDSRELIEKCTATLNQHLRVEPLRYVVERGEQKAETDYDEVKAGKSFKVRETTSAKYEGSSHSAVRYDLVGQIATDTRLTRRTAAAILQGINAAVFAQFKSNPEDFISQATRLINEQKATVIVEHLAYNALDATHSLGIFTQHKDRQPLETAFKADHHIYDYVFTDSDTERKFVEALDTSTEVVVYAKLPRSFFIPTPVGNYNPDWAIAFEQGAVKHVFFVAETKGSMSSLQLREIEKAKIECARRFFANITAEQVRYDVVSSYGDLVKLVH